MRKKRPSSRSNSYEIGYGRPPEKSKFQPGKSGNPKGRPKGSKNEQTILHEILHRQIEVRDQGRRKKITVLQGMLLKFAEDALKGNPKAAAFLLGRYGAVGSDDHAGDELSVNEQEILNDYARRISAQIKKRDSR
ncbi:MAG: DUF5681 domain-containing protein [Pseudorhodoplanes sp.]